MTNESGWGHLQRNFLLTAVIFTLILSAGNAIYIDASATKYANFSSNVTIKGYIKDDGGTGQNVTNFTGSVGNSNFSFKTNTSYGWALGYFEFNVTAPNSTGRVNITLNTTTGVVKNFEIFVANITGVAFNFTEKRPPFTNGTSFLVNLTFLGTSLTVPKLEVFTANGGNSTGWVINNLSTRLNVQTILYNITVPSGADGRYVIMFEEGAGSVIFLVKSTVVLISSTGDTSNSSTTNFGQGETIKISGKLRDDTNAISNASVIAFITSPTGSVSNVTLTPSTDTNGTYVGTFSSAAPGTYDIEIVANSSGKIMRSSSSASIQVLQGKLDIVKDFFFDFGSAAAFRAGGPVEFNVLITNLSNNNDILLNGTDIFANNTDVNCTAIKVEQFKNVNNQSLLSNPVLTKSLNSYQSQNICKIRLTAPVADGVYSLTINATVGNQTYNMTTLATGYFTVQSYILKPSPVSSLGGGKEFLTFLMPGDNATFEITARNLSSNGTALAGSLITNITALKIIPLTFNGPGQTEITNVTIVSTTAGSATENPKVKIRLPENLTGPATVQFQALIGLNTFAVGNAAYYARYVEGFAFPQGFGGGFGTGEGQSSGGGQGNFSGGTFKCSAQQVFSAKVLDVRTRQAARNVVFNGIIEAREEATGKSVTNQLVIVSSASTDSSGFGNFTLNFTGQFSGNYFMLINITTSDGKVDTLPSGFQCKQISFFPQIQPLGSQGGFSVSPNSGVIIYINNVRNLATGAPVGNGSIVVDSIESFDPVKGQKILKVSGIASNIFGGAGNITIFPTNINVSQQLGGKWFNGFNNLRIRVTDTDAGTTDMGMGGFNVVAFDAYPDFMQGPPSTTLTAGQSATYFIQAKTNVTNFTVQVGLPWEGSLVAAVITNYSKTFDSWNTSLDNTNFNGFEKWNITFTVPTNLRKGGNMVIIKVNNYIGESTDVMTFATASSLSISVPDFEGIFGPTMSMFVNVTNSSSYHAFGLNLSNMTQHGFNGTRSLSGFVCNMTGFNVTRFTQGQQAAGYNQAAMIMVLDNTTPFIYDTLVINNSGAISVATASNRSFASANFPGLYLIGIEGCSFVKILNSTASKSGFGAGFGGQQAVNSNATIPFIVKQGSVPKANINVNIAQMVQQQDFGGGRGGYGFTGLLDTANYTVYPVTTDANGVAFLKINVGVSGIYSMLWNTSDAGTLNTADFSEGIPIEIKSFNTFGGISQSRPLIVTLDLNTTSSNIMQLGSHGYIGRWNELVLGTFAEGDGVFNYTFALRNVTQVSGNPQMLANIAGGAFTELVIDNDEDLNTSTAIADSDGLRAQDIYGNWTGKFTMGPFPSETFVIDGTNTINSTEIQLSFAKSNTIFDTSITSNTSTIARNITLRACASSFEQPSTPLINANVSRVASDVFMPGGPPQAVNLTMFDPFTSLPTESVLTGPSGCATFNVTKSGGWVRGSPNQIKARITYGGNTEQSFLGNVFVICQGAC